MKTYVDFVNYVTNYNLIYTIRIQMESSTANKMANTSDSFITGGRPLSL